MYERTPRAIAIARRETIALQTRVIVLGLLLLPALLLLLIGP